MQNTPLLIVGAILVLLGVMLVAASNRLTPTTQPTEGVHTYTSKPLGLSFRYDASQASVKEEGNTVLVAPRGSQDGQKVVRFPKDKTETLAAAITRQILVGYEDGQCRIEPLATTHSRYTKVEIAYPAPQNPNEPFWTNAAGCNATYAKTNGIRYFLYDPAHPDRFYFFDIGQYAITANPQEAWQDTINIE